MKIIKLITENVKGIKAIEITPDEHFQIISGKNGQGKSSVLDSIWLALGGKDASRGTDKPLRDGENEGFSSVDLGEIKVTRKWKGDKTTLDVTSKEGAKYGSPQSMLDDLIGKLSFDPLSFATQDDKKQKATLQELVGINFDKLENDRKSLYADRTETNRELEKYKALLSKLHAPKGDLPTEEIKASYIISQITEAQNVIRQNDNKRSDLVKMRTKHEELAQEIKELQAQIQQIDERGKALKAEVETLVDLDIEVLQAQLSEVEETNQAIREASEYANTKKNYDLCLDESEIFTKQIKDIDQLKAETLQSAQFPIDGLSFDDNGVNFKGIPFKQCSAAERLKISMAMAMAMNPKLRVIRIMDGSLLDSDNMKVIKDMAQEKDYQVWIEVVDESGTMGVMIEDGQIKEVATV